jgi:hypothetical protein
LLAHIDVVRREGELREAAKTAVEIQTTLLNKNTKPKSFYLPFTYTHTYTQLLHLYI